MLSSSVALNPAAGMLVDQTGGTTPYNATTVNDSVCEVFPLYLVIHKDDALADLDNGFVPSRHVSPSPFNKGVIGLRQDPEQARIRYTQFWGETPSADLILFTFVFSPACIARLTTQLTSGEHGFMPKLYKKRYAHQTRDWGVWHFVGDLPLKSPDMAVTCSTLNDIS